jgi:carbamoyltransferase
MSYFSFHRSADTAFNGRFARLFGPPRDPASHFFTESSGYPAYFGPRPDDYREQARRNQHYADIAASIQRVTEETVLAMVRALHAQTGLSRLCMAGGVALNSVANGRILKESPFEELYIQPAAGDGGGAVGAALHVYHAILGHPRKYVMEHAYLGEEHSEAAIKRFLHDQQIPYEYIDDDDRLLARVVDTLQEGKVIGWFQGRFEWGPRALGNRSILADPRRVDMKDIVNTKIKFREPYRPFAPSVLMERAEEFYELPEPERHYPARFMLLVVDVKPSKREVVPAPTHVDGTGRLQAVSKETSPRYHRLIETFGKATGVPVLLNTSFNLKGEPIVNTPQEAFNSFSKSGMDLLVLDRFLVAKNGGPS